MAFAIGLVFALIVLLVIVTRMQGAKKRIMRQVINLSTDPTTPPQRNVTVTINPPSFEGAVQMSDLAQNILKSMGGAEGIMAMPEIREALRKAALHPGMTMTVTTSINGGPPVVSASGAAPHAEASPVSDGGDLFAQTADPFNLPASSSGRSFAAQMPRQGELGVAKVLSLPSATFDGTRELALELDAIGAPKRRVTAATLAPGQAEDFTVGSRIYVRLDPHNAERVMLLAANAGNPVLPAGTNRLDPIVLGPQMFRSGAMGSAVVKSATQVDNNFGGGTWQLELEVTPERGWPYRAELRTTVSTPEKAARICIVGATLPVRYDPDDPKTMCIDSIALGYGNPFPGS